MIIVTRIKQKKFKSLKEAFGFPIEISIVIQPFIGNIDAPMFFNDITIIFLKWSCSHETNNL